MKNVHQVHTSLKPSTEMLINWKVKDDKQFIMYSEARKSEGTYTSGAPGGSPCNNTYVVDCSYVQFRLYM